MFTKILNLPQTITPLLRRVIVFVCYFVLLTGIVGPKIINGEILFRDGFALYGGIGKAAIFAVIAFVLLARHNKLKLTLKPWQPVLLGWAVCAVAFLALAWISIDNLLAGERSLRNLCGAHAGLLLSLAAGAAASIGPKNIRMLVTSYKSELIWAIISAVAFYFFLFAVYALWQPLASIVLVSVRALVELTGLQAAFLPPHTLVFDKFGITVAQYCSGIESIALFTSLYAVVGLLDWHRLRKQRYFIVFPFALLLLFMLNIVRVYGLIIAGYYINPHIAFSLFHTYAGLVFFVLYSAVFWAIAYKHLLAKLPQKSTTR